MTQVTGAVRVVANGKEYTLWLGMSVLAELQERHGQNALERLDAPKGLTKAEAEKWVPELGILRDLFIGALQRYHEDEADRWLVDDILAQNTDAHANLISAAFPEPEKATKQGNSIRPTRAARTS